MTTWIFEVEDLPTAPEELDAFLPEDDSPRLRSMRAAFGAGLRPGAGLAPIIVNLRRGARRPRVIDGKHRLAVARAHGMDTIAAIVLRD